MVARLVAHAMRSSTPKYMNVINLVEIVYSTKLAFGDQKKIEVLAHVERLGFRILPVPNDLVFRAAEYKTFFSMSFADCSALASAVEHGAVLVTGDPEFRAVEHLVTIAWVWGWAWRQEGRVVASGSWLIVSRGGASHCLRTPVTLERRPLRV